MMISPEEFIEEYKNKSYADLLSIRDEFLEKIRVFENHTYDSEMVVVHPSPEVVYQCNLKYMGKLCELISEKYSKQFLFGDADARAYLEVIRDFLKSKNLGYNTSLKNEIKKRKAGKKYTIQDHIQGMIYSMLTNQTKCHRVEPHLSEIDKLFLIIIQ